MAVMKCAVMVLCLMLVAGIAPATAMEVAAVQGQRFATWDADGDGFLSRDEAKQVDGLPAAFDKTDANQDGMVDPQEYAQFEGAGEE
ncbi:MAG: hypothetical protein PVF51_10525 [Nitrospirota bacterium]|jgi:hypothetical protein